MRKAHVAHAGLATPGLVVRVEIAFSGVHEGKCALDAGVAIQQFCVNGIG